MNAINVTFTVFTLIIYAFGKSPEEQALADEKEFAKMPESGTQTNRDLKTSESSKNQASILVICKEALEIVRRAQLGVLSAFSTVLPRVR